MKIITSNKKASFDYYIEDKYEAGIELQGWEVKSARAANVNLLESFVYFERQSGTKTECFLKNAYFAPYESGVVSKQEVRRDRKLLLSRSQIEKLYSAVKAKGNACVATKLYFNSKGLIKVEVALARGKHTYDKKQAMKQKDLQREAEREIAKK